MTVIVTLLFVCVLCVVSVTDIQKRQIPNGILLCAVGVRLVSFVVEAFFVREPVLMLTESEFWHAFFVLLGDGLFVSLPLFLLTLFTECQWKKAAMGGGDIKLLFVTGLYVGGENNLTVLFLAGIIALIWIQWKKWRIGKEAWDADEKHRYVPFAPSIAIAAILMILFEGPSEYLF